MSFKPLGAAAPLNGCPSVPESSAGAALFIIDPQVDFHEGGSLAVAGANGDSERIAGLIMKNIQNIDHIYVSLDSHHRIHIAHGAFWVDAEGNEPAPFTQILAEDIEAGKFKAADPLMQEWALKYCKTLEAGGRFKHLIWPYHCVMGTPGHAVAPVLMPALEKWSQERGRAITWVLKGQNNHTEMYSALKAEVPVPGDPTTELNTQLIADLAKHSQVIVCGEAKSHCVNWTTRDLVSGWPKGRPFSDIVVLSDGTCSVGGFEEMANEFFTDMEKQGVTLVKADAWEPKAA
jgi:nicotinamidase/pyrazinamidase